LTNVSYCFAASKNSAVKTDKIKSIKDLINEPLILPIPGTANREDIDRIFLKNNVDIKNVLNIHTSEMIISAVKKGLGIGYIISDLIDIDSEKQNIKILEISEPLPQVTINLIYNENYLTTAPRKFIDNYILKQTP